MRVAAQDFLAPNRKAVALRQRIGAKNKAIGHSTRPPHRSAIRNIAEWAERQKRNRKHRGNKCADAVQSYF
jgi:hypothetical protein